MSITNWWFPNVKAFEVVSIINVAKNMHPRESIYSFLKEKPPLKVGFFDVLGHYFFSKIEFFILSTNSKYYLFR